MTKTAAKNNQLAQQTDWQVIISIIVSRMFLPYILLLQGEPPPRVQLVEEATEAIIVQFPELWRLGQAYFSGELQAKVLAGQQARFKVSELHDVLDQLRGYCFKRNFLHFDMRIVFI